MSELRKNARAPSVAITPRFPGPLTALRVRRPSPDLVATLSERLGGLPSGPADAADPPSPHLWLAPGEWLLAADAAGVLEALSDLSQQSLMHVVDVTDGHFEFGIDGDAAADLLSTGCSIDLHPRAFPAGRAARTLFGGISVLIVATAPNAFRLLCDVSYRDHLSAWLEDAAQGFDRS